MELPKELAEKARGRQPFVYNGQTIYEWEQTLDEVHLYMKPPKWALPSHQKEMAHLLKPGEKFPKIEVKITPAHLTVGVSGNPPFIDEDLGGVCIVKESMWMIEDDELHIELQKSFKAEIWESALKGHAKMDVLTKTEVQKKIMLERFQEENPGFDFSGASFNGNVPDPRTFMGGLKYA